MPEIAAPAPRKEAALRRELGRWDLTAIGINQVIGSGVFLMPSQVYAAIHGWSPLGFAAAGVASLLVALCFAEASSRFDTTAAHTFTRARRSEGSPDSKSAGCSGWRGPRARRLSSTGLSSPSDSGRRDGRAPRSSQASPSFSHG
jgi:hypothetical protein